ncbi:hypothetical protein KTR66_19505 [Roseococcus sp. SDR]|uniref:hypothetical protein n=1 Tax=Roseococcus sp. SDR TaxID=2835532 RepID=UPI001BD08A7A|nr:hypothetical protein [Roseococcus sp. SDR]MBS7792195.1 hypothetical protein [Roseococcus sp. SDR]MBV1847509.1 hypothetical protein [Roseococcus sp. SDR]
MTIKNLADLSAEALRGAVTMGNTISSWLDQLELELEAEPASGKTRLALAQLGHRLDDHLELAELLLERAEPGARTPPAPPPASTTFGIFSELARRWQERPTPTTAEARGEGLAEAVAADLAERPSSSTWPAPPSAWNQWRRALLAELYPTRMPLAEIRERLAALPGEPMPNADAVRAYAIQCLRLKREGREIPQGLAPLTAAEAPAALDEAGRTYTPEREALLRRLYPTTMSMREISERLAALPGPEIRSPEAVRKKAEKLGLLRLFQPIPAEFLQAPEDAADCGGSGPEAAPAEDPTAGAAPIAERTWRTDWPFPEEDLPEARDMIRAGRGALDLAEEFGWNLAEAQAWAEQTRQQLALEKDAA